MMPRAQIERRSGRRQAGHTLVELIAALSLAALIALLAGRLLLGSLDAWERDTDRANARRAARAALEHLARDWSAQPRHGAWPPPITTLDLDVAESPVGLFVSGRSATVSAAAWVRLDDGSLWRLELDPATTIAALPQNAAGLELERLLGAPSETSAAATLEAAGAGLISRHVAALHHTRMPADALEAAQVQITVLTAAGVESLGTAPLDESSARTLPTRAVHRAARVIDP